MPQVERANKKHRKQFKITPSNKKKKEKKKVVGLRRMKKTKNANKT